MHRRSSRKTASHVLLFALLTLLLPFTANAQLFDVDFCTLPLDALDLPEEIRISIQAALDDYLNNACLLHDLCYRICFETCTTSLSSLSWAHKVSCDSAFAAALIAWCSDDGADIVGEEHADTFLAFCTAAVPPSVFIGSAVFPAFENVQCDRCNNCQPPRMPDPAVCDPPWNCPGGPPHEDPPEF